MKHFVMTLLTSEAVAHVEIKSVTHVFLVLRKKCKLMNDTSRELSKLSSLAACDVLDAAS
jgi:hypothetical protein